MLKGEETITNTYWLVFRSPPLTKAILRLSLAEIPVAVPALTSTITTARINPAIGILCDNKDNIKIALCFNDFGYKTCP